MKLSKKLHFLLFIYSPIFLFPQSDEWTWMKGDNIGNQSGIYGTKGVSNPNNKPSGRYECGEWRDLQGNFWIFGGGITTGFDYKNDLWKYNPITNNWTWISGDSSVNQGGIYGTQGVPSVTNKPGARGLGFITWTDNSGNLWLFGGAGYDANSQFGNMSDLWRYNPTTNEWTWMKGSKFSNANWNYGIKGVASPTNSPPSRTETSCSWVDNSGNLWMFGGATFDNSLNQNISLNDLWKYDIVTNQWTWVSGDNVGNQVGVYGTQGVPAPTNKPGTRWCYASWKDANGNFWLFGGEAWDGTGNTIFNDLWKYDLGLNQWVWMSGSNVPLQTNTYGAQCSDTIPAIPGSTLENRARWTDACGNFWLYGSYSTNSLFMFSPSSNKWTWIKGNGYYPNYGAITVSSPTNTPGQRNGAVGWFHNGELWMFGGAGFDSSNTQGDLNDLWKYVPDTACGGCPYITEGVNEINQQHLFSIFPNPSTGLITIESIGEISAIKISNLFGETIVKIDLIGNSRIQKYSLNLSWISSGVYFLEVKTDNKVMVQKFVKE